MIRKKYYVPKSESLRAYCEHKAHNPIDYWFESDFDEDDNLIP